MSTASNRHPLRARIADALSDLLDAKAHRAIGREIGHAGTTISSRGADPNAWPAMELLELAASHEGLGNAVVSYLRPDEPRRQGEAVALLGDLMREVASAGGLSKAIAEAVADGRVSKEERAEIRRLISERRAIDEQVMAELDAADRVTGGVQ